MYKKYFEENKKLWDGIHEITYSKKKNDTFNLSSLLINGQTITDKFSTAENFNSFLHQLEKKLQHKIYPTKRDHSCYLRHPDPNIFFTSPTLHLMN